MLLFVVVIIHFGKIFSRKELIFIGLSMFACRGQLLLNGYMIVMLILFSNFFYHEYITRSNDAKRRKQRLEQGKVKVNGELSSHKNGIIKKEK